MSPLDVVRSIGRPIAYHASLAKHVGGVGAAVFLSQLMYWHEKADDQDLGVYKTSDEWELETGLSYREQATARKKLRDLGLLTETKKRLIHRVYYKLNYEAFDDFIEQIINKNEQENESQEEQENDEIGEVTNAQLPNDENAIGGQLKRNSTNDENATRYTDRDYTETTTENTNKKINKKRSPSSGKPKPKKVVAITSKELQNLGVKEQVANEFLEIRKQKRAKLTELALEGLIRESDKAGVSLNDALTKCVERGWQGFEAEWIKNTQRQQHVSHTQRVFDKINKAYAQKQEVFDVFDG